MSFFVQVLVSGIGFVATVGAVVLTIRAQAAKTAAETHNLEIQAVALETSIAREMIQPLRDELNSERQIRMALNHELSKERQTLAELSSELQVQRRRRHELEARVAEQERAMNQLRLLVAALDAQVRGAGGKPANGHLRNGLDL